MSASVMPGLLVRALEWLRLRMRQDTELGTLTPFEFEFLAEDLGVTEADLREVLPWVGDRDGLMDEMMRTRGLDPAAVRRAFGPVVRDMDVTCARCRHVGRCRLELEAGTASVECHTYCANADLMSEMLAHGARQSGP